MELSIYFIVGLIFTLSVPSLAPSIKLFYFIPFLIRYFYLKPLSSSLFMALATGFIIDLFSAQSRFGLYSANYTLTTYLLYPMKRNFFEDSFSTLPFMTLFFSLLSTLIQMALMFFLDSHTLNRSFSFLWMDLFLMPLADALFATLVFSLPVFFFGKPIRKGSDYFLTQEEG